MSRKRMRFTELPMAWLTAACAAVTLAGAVPARAQDCSPLLDMLQQGFSNGEIAYVSGVSAFNVQRCRRLLRQSIFIGTAGRTVVEAAGPSPRHAAGPSPFGAAGPPPVAAAGPPPVGAAGPPPIGAAGRSPIGHTIRRLQ